MTESSKINSKLKYLQRFKDWLQIKGYNQRRIINTVGQVDTVAYQIDTGNADLAGIRLLFFSDLHCGVHSSRLLHNSLIESINQADADFVICGGDLPGRSFDLHQTRHILCSCRARSGKIATLGNWERFAKTQMTTDDLRDFYRQSDFTLLCNQVMNGKNIRFYGIDDIKTGTPEYVPDGTGSYTVLLSHNPDTVIHIANDVNLGEFDLALCGHTHAGQIRLPGIGALASASRYGRKFDCGHFVHRRLSGKNMLISAGIGTSAIPWRLNCRPEVMVVDFITAEGIG